ncbi:MAG: hypothetical protein IKH39_07685 [Candidatus Methanomethylophilaceae archaeon]|nr:hypothetical protein [Candidatus Methanomethylophilaceae archaeon]
MVERKDISDMSFEEFFKKSDDEGSLKKTKTSTPSKDKAVQDDDSGFGTSTPKINYKDGRFQLYVPRYRGNGPFNTAVESAVGVMPVSRLDSVRIRDYRLTRPTTLDLTELGISPIDEFTLIIDEKPAFVNKGRDVVYFNSEGLPVGKASGETIVVSRKGTHLRLNKASLLKTEVIGTIVISWYDVAAGGSVSIESDEPAPASEKKAEKPSSKPKVKPSEPETKPEEKASEPAKASAKQTKAKGAAGTSAPKKRVKKPTVKVSVSLPVGNKEASISVAGDVIPLFTEFPSATISVEGCEPSECTIFVTDSKGEVVYGRLPVEDDRMELRTGHADGHLTVTVEKEGKTLSSASYFLVPDFSCSYSGKGDIPEDTNMEFTLFGQEYSKDIYDDDLEGPYYHGDDAFNVLWSVPVVTYDLGEGPKPYEQLVLNADELRSSMLVVKVRGAKKKKMYFGPESGKKEDISKDWDTDSIHINLPPLLDQVYASTKSYCFFISINSSPNKKFIIVRNPESIKATVDGDKVVVEAVGNRSEYVCRMYLQDKSYADIPLVEGTNEVKIPADAVEAEIIENFRGEMRRTTPVKVRRLPFVSKIAGDMWLYVSKDKRIPIPDNLFKNGVPDLDAVAAWHGKIVSMNSELKVVPLNDMKAAFTDFKG